jgi:Putative auto-transporter adhesin, head GIN domain
MSEDLKHLNLILLPQTNIMKHLFLLTILFTFVFSSCHLVSDKRIRGNGTFKTQSRPAGTFSNVDVRSNIDLYIKQDSVRSIRIEADENLLEYIIIKTEGDKLIIEPEDGYKLSGSKKIRVYVSSPVFKKLEASGACDIYGENMITSADAVDIDLSGSSDVKLEVKSPKVEAELSGAGSIELKGETKDLFVHGSGSTDIKCFEMIAENVKVEISGSGDAEVFANAKLDVEISGSGHIDLPL